MIKLLPKLLLTMFFFLASVVTAYFLFNYDINTTWYVIPVFLSSCASYIITAKRLIRDLNYLMIVNRFEFVTRSGVTITGESFDYVNDSIILVNKDVNHVVSIGNIRKFYLITKDNGREQFTLKSFLLRFPRK